VFGNLFESPQHAATLVTWVIFLVSFLIGSIPFGLIIARVFKIKAEAMKLSRVRDALSPGLLTTFFLDISKGVIAVLLASPLGYQALSAVLGIQTVTSGGDSRASISWAAGLFAVIGHCYSPWLHFRGGNGVAVAFGITLMLSPVSALCGLLGFSLTFLHKRITSLSSVAGLCLTAIAYLVLSPLGAHLWIGAVMLFLILVRHEANIDALLENREATLDS
jgi:glycerol-3-phosphate acyltransferase PlsY